MSDAPSLEWIVSPIFSEQSERKTTAMPINFKWQPYANAGVVLFLIILICAATLVFCKGCEKIIDQTSRIWSAARNLWRNVRRKQPIRHPEATPTATPAATPAAEKKKPSLSEFIKKFP